MTGEPYSKARQLSRGERRYRRKVASPKQWQAIIAAKGGQCRLCGLIPAGTLHHLVPRDRHGDDVADNVVPLCLTCHECVELRFPGVLAMLDESLSDSERAYVVGKLGEDGLVRLFGATR